MSLIVGTFDDESRRYLNKYILDYINNLRLLDANIDINCWYLHFKKCTRLAYFGWVCQDQSLAAHLVLMGCHVRDGPMTLYKEFLYWVPYLDEYLTVDADEWRYTEPTKNQYQAQDHPGPRRQDENVELARIRERTRKVAYPMVPNMTLKHLPITIVRYVQTLCRVCPESVDEYWYQCDWLPLLEQTDFGRDGLNQSLEAQLVLLGCVCDARACVEDEYLEKGMLIDLIYERLMEIIPFLGRYLTVTPDRWFWKDFTDESLRKQYRLAALLVKAKRG